MFISVGPFILLMTDKTGKTLKYLKLTEYTPSVIF